MILLCGQHNKPEKEEKYIPVILKGPVYFSLKETGIRHVPFGHNYTIN